MIWGVCISQRLERFKVFSTNPSRFVCLMVALTGTAEAIARLFSAS